MNFKKITWMIGINEAPFELFKLGMAIETLNMFKFGKEIKDSPLWHQISFMDKNNSIVKTFRKCKHGEVITWYPDIPTEYPLIELEEENSAEEFINFVNKIIEENIELQKQLDFCVDFFK